MIFKNGEGEGPEVEVRCSHLTQSGNILIPGNRDKSPMYVTISRATMKTTQRDMLKHYKHTEMES